MMMEDDPAEEDERHFTNRMDDLQDRDADPDFRPRCTKCIIDAVDTSLSRKHRSPSVYIGTSGAALLLISLAETAEIRKSQAASSDAIRSHFSFDSRQCLETALRLSQESETMFGTRRQVTFLEGTAGCVALQALLQHQLGNEEAGKQRLQYLTAFGSAANLLDSAECELLYGRAGWLFCVAFIRRHLKMPTFAEEETRLVIANILREGLVSDPVRRKQGLPLDFSWHSSVYLGAAHGFAGIFLTLLQFVDTDLPAAERIAGMGVGGACQAIEQSVRYIMDELRFPSGNVRSSLTSDRDRLVHWCHGAPGWLPVIARCAELFPNNAQYYKRILVELGEVVWKRGLLRKGLGICHGIGGNGLALLVAYRATGDALWLRRAKHFAHFGIKNFVPLAEVPDRPRSLYEGVLGFAAFLNELQRPETATFIGFEV